MGNSSHKIDFVLAWVDGSDPAWQAEKAKYRPNVVDDARTIRYRDWDNLHYWFRGVEKFAPWVNKIHFVTWGHIPSWLNTSHPKLNIVKHEDYIPKKYLPTFNANPIENNFHLIKGLSEHFVYFNDDFFIVRPTKPDVFFKNGLPIDTVGENLIFPKDKSEHVIKGIHIINIAILNQHFYKPKVLKQIWKKWFSLKNGKFLPRSLLCFAISPKVFTGISKDHLPSSFLKSIYEETWEKEYEILDSVSGNRFRSPLDVNQHLFKYWQIFSGKFEVSSMRGKVLDIGLHEKEVIDYIKRQKGNLFCLLEDKVSTDEDIFNEIKTKLNGAFDSILPDKCSFEV